MTEEQRKHEEEFSKSINKKIKALKKQLEEKYADLDVSLKKNQKLIEEDPINLKIQELDKVLQISQMLAGK